MTGGSAPPRPAQAHAVITGRVQGVSYRAAARNEAESLGLRGWVKNLPDGSVEILAEGPREKVEQLLAWCRKGPRLARVEDVEVDWRPAEGSLPRFGILH